MVDTVQHQPPTPLEYSRPPALAWVARRRGFLIFLAVAIAVTIPIYRNREALAQRVRWLYWSHRCATFQMPADVEVEVTDPLRARQLLATNPDYIPGFTPSPPEAFYCPHAWRMLKQVDRRCDWISSLFPDEDAIDFLGSRRRPDGVWRLVVVSGALNNGLDLLAGKEVLVLPRPGLFDSLPRPVGSLPSSDTGRFEGVDMRGGVADTNDPSHITFTVIVPSSDQRGGGPISGTIDAYLQNDDSLSFKLRSTPGLNVTLGRDNISGVIPRDFVDGPWSPPH